MTGTKKERGREIKRKKEGKGRREQLRETLSAYLSLLLSLSYYLSPSLSVCLPLPLFSLSLLLPVSLSLSLSLYLYLQTVIKLISSPFHSYLSKQTSNRERIKDSGGHDNRNIQGKSKSN